MTPLRELRTPSTDSGALVVLVLACLALHAITLTRFPAIWLDEAIFTDPAVHLAWAGRLSSTAWYFQDDAAFWAANVPLYPVLLAAWIDVFGLSLFSVRAFNPVLAAMATVLIVDAVRRQGWIDSWRWRAWLVLLCLCGYGMVLAHRGTRYDALGLLLCAAALWGFTRPTRQRVLMLFGTACLIPWAGLHVAVYVGLLALGWLAWGRRRAWRDAAALGLGLAVGMVSLAAVLDQQGALDAFLLNVRLSGYAGKKDGPRDPSLILLLVALAVVAASGHGRALWRRSPPALGWIAAGTVVPMIIFLAARFPVYYAWMAVVPLGLGLAMVFDAWPAGERVGLPRRVAMVCMLGALATGLPVQTAITLGTWQQRDATALDGFAERAGVKGQVVLVDPELFYATRGRAAKTYFSMYDFSLTDRARAQRSEVGMMIVAPHTQAALARQLGGQWEAGEVFETVPPPGYAWLSRHLSHSLFGGYRLQVFRRRVGSDTGPPLTAAGA